MRYRAISPIFIFEHGELDVMQSSLAFPSIFPVARPQASRRNWYEFIQDDRLRDAPTVQEITRATATALLDTPCLEILDRFLTDPALYAVPVIDAENEPHYLVDRNAYMEFFTKPYTREIFGRRGVQVLLTAREYHNHHPIVVDASSSIEDVAQIIIDAGMHHMVTGVIVTQQGRYLGVVNGHDLLNLITQRKQAELFYLAHYDHLTSAPNRMLVADRLQRACLEADRCKHLVGLLFIDVDRFKIINDSLGHSFGDAILRMIATRLKLAVREMDTVGRLGGDEFVVLMENIEDVTHAEIVARRMLESMREPMDIFGHSIAVSVSIGIAIYPTDDTDGSRLLAKADAAMYEAKAAGRNNFRIYQGQISYNPAALSLENELRRAIDSGELILHFQPQVKMPSRQICGVEALVRWKHPERGMISPAEFIPLAEQCGLIARLGEWVLRNACHQLGEWNALGFNNIRMSINVSALQFYDPDFLRILTSALNDSAVDPRFIELELTESVLMHDVDGVLAILEKIRALGVSLAIDDFGTGFSSLNYLRLFPINRLKIDQSFIRDIEHTPANESITRAIIALAESLALEIVAEGIEKNSEKNILETLGCTEGQGYFFAKPLAAADLLQWLKTHCALPD